MNIKKNKVPRGVSNLRARLRSTAISEVLRDASGLRSPLPPLMPTPLPFDPQIVSAGCVAQQGPANQ